ncbi:hypothetical protein N7505_002175 [Penicillium chrysogenum]|uniref:Uncharacterized protein n=1 Tax=Penicillium chrysogenum TaxID=5076 RepID=A0ABQ8X0P7_PENCH|nr:hypothetical protein N7505_002175 [Penicillium chrysogenum]
MCNYSKAKGLVTYHYRHGTSGSATVALSSTPRLSSFLFLLSSTSSLLSFCAIALFLLLLSMNMNPYISWAILLVVAGGLGWYYTNGTTPKANVIRAAVEKTETTVAPKKAKRKSKPAPEPVAAKKPEVQTVVSPPTTEDEKPDEEIDRKEMARRMAGLKTNAPAQPAPTKPAPTKSQKKNKKKAAQLDVSDTRASSTTGAEADDDLSSAGSPSVNATVPSAGYVSDMLEAPAPGASVLRVTGNVESQPKKQKPQAFKEVETKKQRQQRLKNEARKQQVQEAEFERKKLLEKQLHTAREAERREAARSTAPAANAWQTKGNTAPVKTNGNGGLLDTFESPAAPAPTKWAQNLPSEEEQMRLLGAAKGDDEWTTVSKKQPKKKGAKSDESVSETSASENQSTPVAPAPVEPRVTVTPTYLPDILRSREKGHPLDSDWAA